MKTVLAVALVLVVIVAVSGKSMLLFAFTALDCIIDKTDTTYRISRM